MKQLLVVVALGLASRLGAGPAADLQRVLVSPPGPGADAGVRDADAGLRAALALLVELEAEEDPPARPVEVTASLDLLRAVDDGLRRTGRPQTLGFPLLHGWLRSAQGEAGPAYTRLRRRMVEVLRTLPRDGSPHWDRFLAAAGGNDAELQAALAEGFQVIRAVALVRFLASCILILGLVGLLALVTADPLGARLRTGLRRLRRPWFAALQLLFVVLVWRASPASGPGLLGVALFCLYALWRIPPEEAPAADEAATEVPAVGGPVADSAKASGPGDADPTHPRGSGGSLAACPPELLVARLLDELGRERFGQPRLLGRGGMGAVFALRDETLARTVALKCMDPGLAEDPEQRLRFLREAKALAAVDHPGVPEVHDVRERPLPFLLMEFVEGESLEELARAGGALEPDAVRGWLLEAAEALGAAHARGVVHRDVKPQNLMLDVKGRVRLVDFGLAFESEASRVTSSPGPLGTPRFMPPEQFRGEPPTPANDVYALAAAGYYLLAGAYPYTLPQVAAGEAFRPAPLPESVPADLAGALECCLALQARERPGTMAEMAALLRGDSQLPGPPA